MDIAAVSMAMSSAQGMQQVSLCMLRKGMDMQQQQLDGLMQLVQSATPAPSFGHKMDFRV